VIATTRSGEHQLIFPGAGTFIDHAVKNQPSMQQKKWLKHEGSSSPHLPRIISLV
jgi:hypothetical protein